MTEHTKLVTRLFREAKFRGKEVVEMRLFYAEWCGHCQNMKSEWNEAAKVGAPYAVWTEFDCSDNRSLAMQHKVQSFPTVQRACGNDVVTYYGERTSDAFIRFAKQR